LRFWVDKVESDQLLDDDEVEGDQLWMMMGSRVTSFWFGVCAAGPVYARAGPVGRQRRGRGRWVCGARGHASMHGEQGKEVEKHGEGRRGCGELEHLARGDVKAVHPVAGAALQALELRRRRASGGENFSRR
jgi:hypothetical protein